MDGEPESQAELENDVEANIEGDDELETGEGQELEEREEIVLPNGAVYKGEELVHVRPMERKGKTRLRNSSVA